MAISFSSFHKKWCLEKTQYFFQLEFSQWFRYSPEHSIVNYEEYLKIVKNPICLTTVTDRIKHGIYRYVHEWDMDMMRIWENAMVFNEKNSIPFIIAKYLKEQYEEMCHPIPRNAYENDVREAMKQVEKITKLISEETMPFKKLTWSVDTLEETAAKKELWKPLDFEIKKFDSELAKQLSRALEIFSRSQ